MRLQPSNKPAILAALTALLAVSPTDASTPDPISSSTRAEYMQLAMSALEAQTGTRCPFAAFGAVIVDHTAEEGPGNVICTGVNSVRKDGNPTLHGKSSDLRFCARNAVSRIRWW
jgi:tRNA(Arg) A34 adenosine deaminase TadA